MGLIKAALGSAGGVLADQWKEYFYCESIPADILAVKGQKRTSGRSSNTKGSDNIITSGSIIAVADGQCMMIVEQGKVVEVCAEPGEFTFDASTEPSIFSGNLGESIGQVFQQIGKRFTFGGEAPKDQRVYYFNTKEIIGNKYGTASPVPFRVVDQRAGIDLDISIRCFGEYSYKLVNPLLFYTNVCGNVAQSYSRAEIDSQLKSELLTALQPAFARISEMGIRYGIHMEKANKVLKSFSLFQRSMGVILSGDKGIGKSLFARCLCEQAVAAGHPVIIIDQFVPGIAAYIESIDQEAVFLFDEFDKTFGDIRAGDNEANPQARLLSLFDGTAQGKKLFIITCNSLYRLNDYLVNRPGRFHYHFRFDYPTPEEILAYLTDKLGSQYQAEIEKVILFSKKVSLNYDCLRAIAFELSLGEPFEKAILDLNIVNTNAEDYNITLRFKNGDTMTAKKEQLDLFDRDGETSVYLWDDKNRCGVNVMFNPSDCVYDSSCGALTLAGDCITLSFEGTPAERKAAEEKLEPERMTLTRAANRNIHYLTA